VIKETYGVEITFLDWFLLAFPISVAMLFMCWWYLTKVAFKFEQQTFPGGKAEVQRQLAGLGKMSRAEKRVLTVFVLMALAWISRSFVLVQLFPGIDDTIIAIVGALVLFILPAERGKPLVNWEDTHQLPWGIIVLFGGGIALATGFEDSGLAAWIGSHLTALHAMPFWLLLLLLVASVNFLTEITSNLATTAMILPVLVSIAASMEVHPFYLVMGATLAASCAFMLPVATPPNAVVFGSGYLKIEEMVKNGFWMNVISILIVAAAVYFLLPLVWDLQLVD
jgi:sodium-dependent dicarboxylate transporter 2/3/5